MPNWKTTANSATSGSTAMRNPCCVGIVTRMLGRTCDLGRVFTDDSSRRLAMHVTPITKDAIPKLRVLTKRSLITPRLTLCSMASTSRWRVKNATRWGKNIARRQRNAAFAISRTTSTRAPWAPSALIATTTPVGKKPSLTTGPRASP